MMNKQTKVLFAVGVIATQCAFSEVWAASPGRIVVANRTSGTLSIIDENSDTLIRSVSVAGKFARPPEPMYVNYIPKYNRLLVNDRANKQIIALNADNYKIINTIKTGAGAFHMWSDGVGKQTWTVNDMDKSFTVINPKTLTALKTVGIPEDLKSQGGKPHDILLDKKGKWAITTIVGVTGEHDYVVQYNTKNFKEIARQAVGKDPHVGVLNDGKLLFVPTQNANKVYVMNPNKKLEIIKELTIPGAHGAAWTPNGNFFYTSNLPKAALADGKNDMLWAINAKTLEIAGSASFPATAADTGLQAAHNLTINAAGNKLYLTHSGHEPGSQIGDVTVYNISDASPAPTYANKRIPVGLNPFGIGYIPPRNK